MITRQKQSGKAAKRLLCILLVACLAVTGCGGQTEQDTTVTTQETDLQEEETTEGTQAEPDETEPDEDGEPLWADPDTYEVSAWRPVDPETGLKEEGVNLIHGMEGTIRDAQGSVIQPYAGSILQLTKDTPDYTHIDIMGHSGITITYDLGQEYEIDKVLISNFYHATVDYSVGRYQLFVGNNEETLYTQENCIADYDNSGKWKGNVDRTGADQLFQFPDAASGSFFGIRILESNPTDDLVRIAKICLYNDEYTAQRAYYQNQAENWVQAENAQLLDAQGAEIASEGSAESLTDGVIFTDEALSWQNAEYADLLIPIDAIIEYDRLVFTLVMPEDGRYEISFTDHRNQPQERIAAASEDRTPVEIAGRPQTKSVVGEHIFSDRMSGSFLCIRMYGEGEWKLEELGLYSNDRVETVRTSEVVNDDFLGYGVNLLPMALMEESLSNSYKESLFALEYKRITTIRPRVARIWFQIDWMEAEKGVYDFDSERMQAVYPNLDALKEAGTLVELNFGWKIGSQAAKWFSADGTNGSGGAPAPADLEHYADSCAALLTELIDHRGYDNIYAISAYNEPNFSGEFEYTAGNKMQYYLDMMEEMDRAFTEAGLRDRVEIWGPEESGSFEWYDYMAQNGQEVYDAYTFHVYGATCTNLEDMIQTRLEAAQGKPALLTEFGFLESETTWETGNAAYAMTAANAGLSGALFWVMTGVRLADPGTYTLSDKDRHLWGPLQNGVDFVYRNYYEYGLLMRYVQPHSKVYSVSSDNEDIRAAMFEAPDGNLTIAVQVREQAQDRYLNLQFDQNLNTKFHKYVYTEQTAEEANALLPVCEGCVTADTSLKDHIGTGYSLIVYTTEDPGPQIVMDQVKVEIESGASVDLSASVLGSCEQPMNGDEELVWSIVSGSGTMDPNGHYQSEEGLRRYTTIAVKAELKSDPSVYGIGLVVLT